MSTAAPARNNRESEFLKRYSKLLNWAHSITRSDRALAEDIVQDAFIQFMVSNTDYVTINNLDHYLHEVIRNVHRNYIRQRPPQRFEQLSTMPADTSTQIWSSTSLHHELMDAQQTLVDICRFVCKRKRTSVAISVLILRTFYDYYPEEIARLTGRTRNAVDGLLRSARGDLKKHLHHRDENLAVGDETSGSHAPECNLVRPNLVGLRQMLLTTRTGNCFGKHTVGAPKLSRDELSHLVSCPTCLDERNRFLGLSLLNERFPLDGLEMIANRTGVPALQ